MVIRMNALTLVYAPNKSDGKFTDENLSISFNLAEKEIVWKPGMLDAGNLLGTYTLRISAKPSHDSHSKTFRRAE
jgi:hypothetical protein